jgi:hypothetical protein
MSDDDNSSHHSDDDSMPLPASAATAMQTDRPTPPQHSAPAAAAAAAAIAAAQPAAAAAVHGLGPVSGGIGSSLGVRVTAPGSGGSHPQALELVSSSGPTGARLGPGVGGIPARVKRRTPSLTALLCFCFLLVHPYRAWC